MSNDDDLNTFQMNEEINVNDGKLNFENENENKIIKKTKKKVQKKMKGKK